MTIIKKFEPAEPRKTFSKKYIALVVISLFVLMVIEIWANNNVAVYGEKLQKLSFLQKTLNLENQILENEIAKQVSLTNVASKSAELGFSKPESIQYIR
ncbi:MAG: hypothetical protein ACD_38C00058G0008 [uncultured bacterium]|uniref:Cell division protein FtsL n=1 Tax=Candidatus Daviesbacteria bacterium GW2011_GWC2_40_12 TaxID=1618431 RepID=A0A0G0QZ76_9BACT|nr:MAG: hypothetical protein ACD_38C00058G0008 [uncultured bacterium]KKQ85155.1 MAG: hypothetical protein UT04_C0007G0014 [Candidatus Daviesbacteria bacterium GW2011_GWF2_38_7]KKR17349.1 MAG: hypothetical protein UT45_C0001G0024 [Candidatus Daviesbacteria bacterium GW2011_GWA2_39_33]KKR24929.1 MAG: hypothetical protein UT54_C0009G0003 [Candidatus Daviesbacteria bacterium GW2011_GWB1_39_5]KKR42726.1 MAG: hypothetical protein UT77_C0001G0177 [Candidatus Daviesbacteria bacterium GW2011_GWC2_40_12]